MARSTPFDSRAKADLIHNALECKEGKLVLIAMLISFTGFPVPHELLRLSNLHQEYHRTSRLQSFRLFDLARMETKRDVSDQLDELNQI